MKLAIMQPYFFPYLGYWQLLASVDKFIVYDDVNYIKGGWVNRNRILINKKPSYISIPLLKASPNKKIIELSIQSNTRWKIKMLKSIDNSYRRSAFFPSIFPLIEKIIKYETEILSDYLLNQINCISEYMGINTEIITSNNQYNNADLKGQDRIVDICRQENATVYTNLEGGTNLYNQSVFKKNNIDLLFIQMNLNMEYKQQTDNFIPYLSILDLLMNVDKSEINSYLNNFNLIKK